MSIIRHHLKQGLDRARILRYERKTATAARMQARAVEHVDRSAAGGVDYI